MQGETCGVCGGDGYISNAFGGSTTKCPACHGNGRSSSGGSLFRDVTKTKPSHYGKPARTEAAPRPTWPTTTDGTKLAIEVRDCPHCSNESKVRLTREIIDHEESHGLCTQTFLRKVRKQLRPPA